MGGNNRSAARTITVSTVRIFLGTAMLGVLAETANKHLGLSGAAHHPVSGHRHPHDHHEHLEHNHPRSGPSTGKVAAGPSFSSVSATDTDVRQDLESGGPVAGTCDDGQCSPGHISLTGGRLALRHDDGPFSVFLNGLGGVVSTYEGRRIAKSVGGYRGTAYAVAAATLAAVAHATTHVVIERGEGRQHLLRTVSSRCHRRLLLMSAAGSVVGSVTAGRTGGPRPVTGQ